ncbi:Glycosyltransferase involved in cell wall bisynthesis [Butyrivibrio proteoclasticus]|uniref:Glycosyltransferase involved in cell wall bisynthesis n=1 Tax=Butyrivibrio proteoclasticus TaxID=43305 RepID=A0A1I5PTT5_9FIRM|nr:glycosyltransferase family 4 protein [Butyrivibrio proteoclasticus]SFP37482.1 Glycosyltransferase involved in cell wall bisynthesis [Butyrivibrio proteoclasticus]
MKKIAFVAPWFGENIPGGAEMAMREHIKHLYAKGIDIEVLTTCVKQFTADWNIDYYTPGLDTVMGIPTRRFKVRKRDTHAFDVVNTKLMNNVSLTDEEEETFVREMVNSPDMYKYISEHQDEYSLFVYIPYMFGTTINGILACPEKAVVIPCFHEESYIHMRIFKDVFEKAAGMLYNAEPEKILANEVFDFSNVKQLTLGIGLDNDFSYDEKRFREKYKVNDPFILYAGRKDVGKNIYTLINYFREYKDRNKDSKLKLVLIGGGEVTIPDDIASEVIDIGFVDRQDKYDACAAASMMCQPSIHESFSLVIMESWLCERPVIVHNRCDVTKNFVKESNAGLYFDNYFEFEGCVDYILNNPEVADKMGKLGRKYVLETFDWDVITKKAISFFEEIAQ